MQQQAGQLQATRVYLPSAPTSVKPFQMSTRNVMSLAQEHEHLGREVRASVELYMVTGDQGQKLPVLLQPVQASERAADEEVPTIQLQELCLRNAGPRIRDQALAQNLIIFNKREKDCVMKEQSENRDVTALADTISGASLSAPILRASQLQLDAAMDTTEKTEGKTDEGNGVKTTKSSGEASDVAEMT